MASDNPPDKSASGRNDRPSAERASAAQVDDTALPADGSLLEQSAAPAAAYAQSHEGFPGVTGAGTLGLSSAAGESSIAGFNARIHSAESRWGEKLIKFWLWLCAGLSLATTATIIVLLLVETLKFFQSVSPAEFFFGTRWVPLLEPSSFGVLPLLWGTMQVTIGAAVIAIPLGLASAIYLSEYASPRMRAWVKPILELLAGIPTIVYGYFALTFVTPLLKVFIPDIQVFNALSAAIVVGIMILPAIATLSDNALRAVPDSLRQAAYALGATSFEVTTRVVVPAGLSGVIASFLLGISRAIGETMAVAIAAG